MICPGCGEKIHEIITRSVRRVRIDKADFLAQGQIIPISLVLEHVCGYRGFKLVPYGISRKLVIDGAIEETLFEDDSDWEVVEGELTAGEKIVYASADKIEVEKELQRRQVLEPTAEIRLLRIREHYLPKSDRNAKFLNHATFPSKRWCIVIKE